MATGPYDKPKPLDGRQTRRICIRDQIVEEEGYHLAGGTKLVDESPTGGRRSRHSRPENDPIFHAGNPD